MNAFTPVSDAPWRWTGPPEPAAHRFTLDEVLALRASGAIHPDARIELLDGEIIEMPEEGELHVWFKIALNRFFVRALDDALAVAPDATLSLAPQDAPDPDFYILPVETPLRNTPGSDLRLLVEISDSSLNYDLRRKAEKYARNGVSEYWVIDVRGRRTFVHLQPEGDGYLQRTVVPFDQPLVPTRIEGVRLVVSELPRFDQLDLGGTGP